MSLWTVDDDGNHVSDRVWDVCSDWNVIGYDNNQMLWRKSNTVLVWWVPREGMTVFLTPQGPFAGWSILNSANQKILWKHTSGRASYWTTDSWGNRIDYQEL